MPSYLKVWGALAPVAPPVPAPVDPLHILPFVGILLPYGEFFGDEVFPPMDDDSSAPLYRMSPFPIFGEMEDTLYVRRLL